MGLFPGPVCQRVCGLPLFGDLVFQPGCIDGNIRDEAGMVALGAVIGHFVRSPETVRQQGQVKAVEDGAVKKNETLAAALGIAGKFEVAEGEIADAAHGGSGRDPLGDSDGPGYITENILVCAGDGFEFGPAFAIEHEGEVEASGTLEYGAATAASPQNGYAVEKTFVEIDVAPDGTSSAENNEMSGAFPQPQDFVLSLFGVIEECFFQGEVFGRGG